MASAKKIAAASLNGTTRSLSSSSRIDTAGREPDVLRGLRGDCFAGLIVPQRSLVPLFFASPIIHRGLIDAPERGDDRIPSKCAFGKRGSAPCYARHELGFVHRLVDRSGKCCRVTWRY